jgi:hypothetical protein
MAGGLPVAYQLIVLFLAGSLVWYLWREKKFLGQLSASLVLVIFLLRLFLIK